MVSHLFFSQGMLLALIWLCGMLHAVWPSARLPRLCPPARAPSPPAEKRRYAVYPQRMLMARAASNTTMVKEIVAWSIMSSLAHGESTGASVGDRAVLVLKARNR